MKKICFVLIAFLMVGLFPPTAITANATHEHIAGDWWISDDTGHWNQCIGDGNCQEKLNYQKHDTSVYEKYCEICKNRIDHVCYNPEATCEIGGRCIYCPYGAPVNPDNHNTYGTMIDDKTHKIECSCGYVKVASEPHVLNSWDDIVGQPGMEESWCEVCFHAVSRKKQSSTSDNDNNTTDNNDNKNNTTDKNDNKNNTTGNSGNDGNNSGNGNSNEQSSAPDLDSNGVVQPGTSSPTEIDDATDGSAGTESETNNSADNTDDDKDNSKVDSLMWLWILLIIIAVGGTVTAVVLMKKKIHSKESNK